MDQPFLRRQFLYGSALLGLAGALPAPAQTEAPGKEPLFNVLTYGAVGDGNRLNTRALQAAIDACAAASGGTVYFPAGTYLSGTLVLKSHVGLHLEAGATILGSRNLNDYPSHVPAFKAYTVPYADKYLIYGERLENIFIEGHGTLDGQGASFERKPMGRPYLIRFSECRNVTLRGIRLINSAMWVQHYLACTDVDIDGVRVSSNANHNNDGIDIDCCDRVRIANCEIDSEDDAIVLKSAGARTTRNVTVTNCVLRSHSNGLKAGTESEGGFENIAISNCVVHDTNLAGIALEAVDGATLSGIVVSNIAMCGVVAPIFIRLGNRARPIEPGGPHLPIGKVENIIISDVEAFGAHKTGCSITGLPGHRVRNVTLSNIRLGFQGGGTREMVERPIPEKPAAYPEYNMFGVLPAYGFYCRHVEGLTLSNVHTDFEQPDARPALVSDDVSQLDIFGANFAQNAGGGPAMLFQNVRGAMIHGCRPWQEVGTYLRVEGRESEGIVLVANDLRKARKAFERSGDVPAGSVVSK
jgi:polygalacturonase